MTRSLLASLGAAAAAIATTALLFSSPANADRTIVYRTAGARITRAVLVRDAAGAVTAQVCGQATTADGGVGLFECHDCGEVTFPIAASTLLDCYKAGAGL